MLKRATSQPPLPEEHPAKKRCQWNEEENKPLIKLVNQGETRENIAEQLPPKSPDECEEWWKEKMINKLFEIYNRYVPRAFFIFGP
jgi:hypothetical protein